MLKAVISQSPDSNPLPVLFVTADTVEHVVGGLASNARAWVQAMGFAGHEGEVLVVPNSEGQPQCALFGAGHGAAVGLGVGRLPDRLPNGLYRLAGDWPDPELMALAWELGVYTFDRYKSNGTPPPQLECPEGVDIERIHAIASGMQLARDMINTPANDMGPAEIEHTIRNLEIGRAHV